MIIAGMAVGQAAAFIVSVAVGTVLGATPTAAGFCLGVTITMALMLFGALAGRAWEDRKARS